MKSIVDPNYAKQKYSNPLLVIPYEKNTTEKFNSKLKREIEALFFVDKIKVETFICETKRGDLKLNERSENEDKINEIIKDDQKDLVLVFTPVSINFTNGTIIDAVYEITAIETSNNNEVWKSEFHYKSF
jgi:hypothetical protein